MKRKGTALLCAACLAFTGAAAAMPATTAVYAAETSGTCGENLTWNFDQSTGTLTVEGTGAMENWQAPDAVPWYAYHESITAVTLPDGVTNIGDRAFYKCGISQINLPDSVKSIGVSSFFNCIKLTAVTIPDSVTSIGETAFGGCTRMTELTISGNAKTIGVGAFHYCAGLTEIIVPESVTSIGRMAFYNCQNLNSITIQNPDCEIYDAENTLCWIYDGKKDSLLPQGTIYGYSGSTAEAYATKYGRDFQSLGAAPAAKQLSGDMDGSGTITADDAQMALIAYLKLLSTGSSGLTGVQFETADVDKNGILNADDAQYILIYATQFLAGLNPQWSDIIQ